ncbi:unnamed protein product [Leptidea sinapis]|uniref:Uncharacterized protein n=1 Tax=Leptidea sinapis TaxID=189913 RepID=A0A5E4PU74_9NEOP|nr:unnamed protein product [Leptidea sinapis]
MKLSGIGSPGCPWWRTRTRRRTCTRCCASWPAAATRRSARPTRRRGCWPSSQRPGTATPCPATTPCTPRWWSCETANFSTRV